MATKKRKPGGDVQLPLFESSSEWNPPTLESLPTSWVGRGRVGIDCETKDTDIKTLGPGVRRPGNRIVGVSFAFEDRTKFYLPWGHEGGDNLPEENCRSYIKDMLKSYDGDLVGANLSYELDWFWSQGWTTDNVKRYRDVQIADPLIDELQFSYKLEKILERWGFAGKNEAVLREAATNWGFDPKGELWRLPARYVGAYGEDDALLPLDLIREQEKRITVDGLDRVYDLESRLLPVLVRMRQRGMRVDEHRLNKIEEWSVLEEQKALDIIKHETGVRIAIGNINAASALAPAIEAAGLTMGTTADGKDSVTKGALDGMDHPVAAAIVRARQVNKIRSTFVASMRRHMVNGRIHCSFNQLRMTKDSDKDGESKGVKFGRLSCDNPNMQQQPGRDEEIGPLWRSVFVPDEGKQFASADYSQQEPKWSFHFSEIMKLPGATRICDIFRNDPKADSYDPLAAAAGIKRGAAKIVWLARAYGQGGRAMAENLRLPTRHVIIDKDNNWERIPLDSERGRQCQARGWHSWLDAGEECQAIINKFDGELPFLKRAGKIAQNQAEKNGFVKTIYGRRCHFPTNHDGSYEGTYRAFNRAIQGSAADQTKEAVVQLDAAGILLQLQVHDEINWSALNREEGLAAVEIMENAIPMCVPVRVDLEMGESWGESMIVGKDEKTRARYYSQIAIFKEAA